jgi:serine/threonine protein kinase
MSSARTRFFTRELEIFLTLRPHPSICAFVGCCISPQLAIVMEDLPNGSLASAPVKAWTDTARAKTIFGLACAMMHLHGHGAIHRYLRSATSSSTAWGGGASSTSGSRANNVNFSAIPSDVGPEAIQKEVDAYAFGMIVWHICSGRHPWPTKISKDIGNGIRPESSPALCRVVADMIKECWPSGPDTRPTFAMILKQLIDSDEKLFPGADMVAYRAYRDMIFDATY